MGELGGRLKREGINIYIQVIHLVVQQKLYNIIKRFYSNDKKIKRFAKKKKKRNTVMAINVDLHTS